MESKVEQLGKVCFTVDKEYHNIDRDYDKLVIVESYENKATYASRKPVPKGTSLDNREYWIKFSSLAEHIEQNYNVIQQELNELYNKVGVGINFYGDYSTFDFNSSKTITLNFNTVNSFEKASVVKLYQNDTLMDTYTDISEFTKEVTVSSEVTFKVIAKIGNYTFAATWEVTTAYNWYIGGGATYQSMMIDSNKHSGTEEPISSVQTITVNHTGDYIFICVQKNMILPEITMGGFPIPFDDPFNAIVDRVEYNIYKSSNSYKVGTYVIKLGAVTWDNDDVLKNLLASITGFSVTEQELDERLTIVEEIVGDYNPGGSHRTPEVIPTVDEEDLTIGSNNVFKFKDRPNTDGMGMIILRKDKTFAEQLTQTNTIYIIQYDFDLSEESVTIPENSVLKFDGGTIDNGTIVGNNTIMIYDKPIDEVCPAERQGTFTYNTTVVDEEDITSESGQLKFKDRPATDGMGRKILRKNIVDGVNTLTQSMINQQNTIYIIQYDFTLGEDITIPANCVLEFDGGSVSGNYTITFANTKIEGFPKMNLLNILGTINNYEVNINWFFNSGADISDALQLLIASPRIIHINSGLWYVSKSSKITSSNVTIKGDGPENTTIKVTDAAAQGSLWMFGTDYEYEYDVFPNVTTDDMDIKIRNFNIYDITFNTNRGNLPHSTISPQRFYVVYLKNSENCTISNCKFIDAMTYESNNGEPAITTVLCKNIRVSGCYSSNITLVGFYTGINCKAIDNEGYNSVGTWIETARGYGHIIDGNKINGTYWNSSIIGINCHDCIISNNIIEQEDDRAYGSNSGLTLGHGETLSQAERSFIKNNRIVLNNAGTCILWQCNTDLVNCVFENNYINYTDKSPATDHWAILASGNNNSIFKNNVVISNSSCIRCNKIECSFNTIQSTYNNSGSAYGIQCGRIYAFNNNITLLNGGRAIQATESCICITNIFNNCCINAGSMNNLNVRIESNTFNLDGNWNRTTFIQAGSANGCYPTIKNNYFISSNAGTFNYLLFIVVPTAMIDNPPKTDIKRYINNNVIVGTLNYSNYIVFTNNSTNRALNPLEIDDFGDIQPTLGPWTPQGRSFFNTTVNKPSWGRADKKFVEADGAIFGVSRSGDFASKPAATDIYVGFRYFCTDKQTVEGATDGIEIIHKGNNVWVDALGRVVS